MRMTGVRIRRRRRQESAGLCYTTTAAAAAAAGPALPSPHTPSPPSPSLLHTTIALPSPPSSSSLQHHRALPSTRHQRRRSSFPTHIHTSAILSCTARCIFPYVRLWSSEIVFQDKIYSLPEFFLLMPKWHSSKNRIGSQLK